MTAGAAEMCTVTFHNNGHGPLKVESVQIEKGKNLNGSGTLYFRDTLMGKADGLEHISWGRTPTATVAGPDHFNMNSAVTESMDLYTIHLNPFTDVSSSEYYYTVVLWAVSKNITTGLDPVTFGPNETCTRGQIETFLYRDMN